MTPNGGGGYRSPPKHSQFKKGTSGNPRGRPKGSCDIGKIFYQVLSRRVQLSATGRRKYGPLIEAIALRTVSRALQGHDPSMKFTLQMAKLAQNWSV